MRRLLCISLFIIHLREFGCQNENFSKLGAVSKEVENKDVVSVAEFIGHTEDINDGSDSFVTSTELLEPITEPAVTTDMHQPQTLEPLELTTKQNKNATLLVLNVPAVNADDPHPLPDEVLNADPFSLDGATNTERAVDIPAENPVVPVVHTDSRSFSLVAEPDDDVLSSTVPIEEVVTTSATPKVPIISPALERRVLKEKEEATVPIVSSTTNIHPKTESTEDFFLSKEFHSIDAPIEPSEVAENPVTESGDIKDATSSSQSSLSSGGTTQSSEEKAFESFTNATGIIAERQDKEQSAITETSTTTIVSTNAAGTTVLDEEEPPFDQEKLSGLFEQDGSFIPDHLINQPSSQPMFPRVELPEESTEIIDDQQQRKMSVTSDLPTFPKSSDGHDESTTMTNAETVSTKHKLQQIKIQSTSSKSFVSVMSHVERTLKPNVEDPSIPVESGVGLRPNQHEASISATTFSSEPENKPSLESESWPTLATTAEVIIGVVRTGTESATKSAAKAMPELSTQPILKTELRQKLEIQPKPWPEPQLELTPEPEWIPQPTALPHPELGQKSHAVPEVATLKPDPRLQQQSELKLQPPTATVSNASEPELEPHKQPEPKLQPNVGFEPTAARPEPEPQLQPAPKPQPQPEPELQPQPEPEIQPQPEPELQQQPELKSQPQPEPLPRPKSSQAPEPELTLQGRPSQFPPESQSESPLRDLKKTMLSMRITSVDFTKEFADKSSGQYRKLSEQIISYISSILKPILGDSFVGYDIVSVTKGSVIIEGVILTRHDIHDAEELATKIETSISSNGFMIGPNEVDPRSIAVNGIPSRLYIERVHSSSQSSTSSTLVIGSMIAVGVLIVLIVAFVAIAMNNRRTNGTMKLKDDTIPRIENGKAAYTNPQAISVNLKSYGNGTAAPPTNGTSMMTSLSIKSNEREVC